MARYIDADKLLKYWQDKMISEYGVKHTLNDFLDSIDRQPSARVVALWTGKWNRTERVVMVGRFWKKEQTLTDFTCNRCFYRTGEQATTFRYCPKCGAKMDLSELPTD